MVALPLLCRGPSQVSVRVDSYRKALTVLRWSEWRRVGLAMALACAVGAASPVWAAGPGDHPKLDPTLNGRANKPGKSRVIVLLKRGTNVDAAATALGGKLGRSLELVDGKVLELPNVQLNRLANLPGVVRIV